MNISSWQAIRDYRCKKKMVAEGICVQTPTSPNMMTIHFTENQVRGDTH